MPITLETITDQNSCGPQEYDGAEANYDQVPSKRVRSAAVSTTAEETKFLSQKQVTKLKHYFKENYGSYAYKNCH